MNSKSIEPSILPNEDLRLETNLDLNAFMPYRLQQLAHLVSRGIADLYEDHHGLTAAQWRVMAAVAENPGITAQKVVDMTPMDKVSVSRAVAALCEMALLQRKASDSDGRLALLSLTTDGARIYQQIFPKALDYAEQLQQSLTQNEQKIYLRLTSRLIDSARAIEDGRAVRSHKHG